MKSVTKELEDICTRIAGQWNTEDGSHSIDFTPTCRLLKETPVKLIDKGDASHKTTYIIGVAEGMPILNETTFYFEVGKNGHRKKYLIKEITKEKMVVAKIEGYTEKAERVTFIRNK